jgi:tRNA-2-methylthio-N6-dimethylallyladenosine synthase
MSKMTEIERTPLGEERQGEVLLREGLGRGKKLFLESYGCQMNFSDSEIVASILHKDGYETTDKLEEADLEGWRRELVHS